MLRRTFGEDRVIFGSDYPQSDSVAALPQVVGLAKAAFAGSSTEAREKFFIGNSRKFYKWLPRSKPRPADPAGARPKPCPTIRLGDFHTYP
jgi:hypothetical protein